MTPPGRWLRRINMSTNFTANNDTTSGRNEYGMRYQVLAPPPQPRFGVWVRADEFSVRPPALSGSTSPQLYTSLEPPQQIPGLEICILFQIRSYKFTSENAAVYISKRRSNHPLFWQRTFIWLGCVKQWSLASHHALHAGLKGRSILKDGTGHQKRSLHFLFEKYTCVLQKTESVGAVF